MGSILSNNPSQPTQEATTQNLREAINNIASRILNSGNPQATFQELLNTHPELKSKYDEMNQYANNDPRAAFFNYMNAKSKQSFGQSIMQFFGLKF